tara:strand:+ start:394 stop:852 length:459 start_codon:yes stop_codon:yes gene_type:complete
MKPQLRKATIEDAIYVSQNLRPADLSEIKGLGRTPFNCVLGVLLCEDTFAFTNYNGDLAGIGGVIPDSDGNAGIWTLATPAIETMGLTFFRRAKQHIEVLTKPYNMVYALCDSRNKLHHRFLKFLGFKALRAIPQPPFNIPYYEVVKLCANQ